MWSIYAKFCPTVDKPDFCFSKVKYSLNHRIGLLELVASNIGGATVMIRLRTLVYYIDYSPVQLETKIRGHQSRADTAMSSHGCNSTSPSINLS